MRPDALAQALREQEAAAVVATVGTTSSTSVDPVAEIAPMCAEAGVWLHVDAAYAGPAMVCEENRWAFAGVEQADSLVVNPHKWLFTPIDCSVLYTRRPDVLRDAFSILPEYLRTSDEDVTNLMDYGPALGRRFRSLKLWAVIRCHGREGLRALIREHMRLARLFASWVEETPGWALVAPIPFSVVCFRRGRLGRGERGASRARERDRRGLSLPHGPRRPLRTPPGGGPSPDDGGRRAASMGAPTGGVGARPSPRARPRRGRPIPGAPAGPRRRRPRRRRRARGRRL